MKFQGNFGEDNDFSRYLHRYSVQHVTLFIYFNRGGKDIMRLSISHVKLLNSLRRVESSLGRRFQQINYDSGATHC